MDNPGGSNESGLTDDEKMKVGLQQAALIKMQQTQDEEQQLRERALRQQQMLEQQKEQELMEAQQKALHIRMEQERQQAEEQQKIQLQLQAKAMQERQKEEELKRIQEIALMERQREELQDQPPQPPQPPRLMSQQPSLPGGPPHLGVPPPFPMGAPQSHPGQNLPPPPPQLQGQHQMPSHPGGLPQPPQPPVGGQSMGGAVPPVNRPPALSQPPVTNVPRPAAPPMPPHMTGSSVPPHLSGQSMPNQQSGPMRPPFSSSQQNMQQMMPPRDQQASMMQPPMGQRGLPNQQVVERIYGFVPERKNNRLVNNTKRNMPRELMRSEPAGMGNQQGPPPQLMSRDAAPVPPFQGNDDRERGRPPPLMSMETRPPIRPSEKDEEMPIQQQPPQQQQQAEDEDKEPEFKLPQALEKVLAFKDVRVQEVGVMPEEMERVEKGEIIEEVDDEEEEESTPVGIEDYGEEEDDEEDEVLSSKASKKKESKNQRRKQKKKRAKQRKQAQANMPPSILKKKQVLPPKPEEEDDDVEVEYVVENIELDRTDPSYREFNKIFQAFKVSEPEVSKKPDKAEEKAKEEPVKSKPADELKDDDDDDDDSEEEQKQDDDDKPKLSKKKLKKLNRLSVAELKQLVSRPDVVEMHDVTARDPKLLVNLKATRNSVPVPRHWCFKRKYLQGKRGIEKAPFDLPDFIKNTGIMEMRQALQDKEEAKNLKAKMREKVRPKMGKIDIDYQKLHDAFFKYQTKPKMTIHGDLYYEAKEFETRLKEKKPGNLTDDLRTALGMPLGLNAERYPPPWLIAMQRYGPPPSYPNLKIPGLNAPIPEGCSFGYHAGGWGKPPVDESGKPLYGDVFGAQGQEVVEQVEDEDVDKTRWGELESESEEESESESESEGEEAEAMESGLVTPGDTGLVTPSGVTSVPIGVETPDMIELRKKRIEDAMDQGGDTPALYQVLPEKKSAVGGAMMGSAHVYDISAVAAPAVPKVVGENAEGIEVALNPDELDLDTAAMQAKYEQQVREQQSQLEKEDLSDMVADHAAKQAKKRKKQQQDTTKSAKKYKEFKF